MMTLYIAGNVDNRILSKVLSGIFFSGRKTRDTCACARSCRYEPETLYVQEPMRKMTKSLIWDLDWSPVKILTHTEPLLVK